MSAQCISIWNRSVAQRRGEKFARALGKEGIGRSLVSRQLATLNCIIRRGRAIDLVGICVAVALRDLVRLHVSRLVVDFLVRHVVQEAS